MESAATGAYRGLQSKYQAERQAEMDRLAMEEMARRDAIQAEQMRRQAVQAQLAQRRAADAEQLQREQITAANARAAEQNRGLSELRAAQTQAAIEGAKQRGLVADTEAKRKTFELESRRKAETMLNTADALDAMVNDNIPWEEVKKRYPEVMSNIRAQNVAVDQAGNLVLETPQGSITRTPQQIAEQTARLRKAAIMRLKPEAVLSAETQTKTAGLRADTQSELLDKRLASMEDQLRLRGQLANERLPPGTRSLMEQDAALQQDELTNREAAAAGAEKAYMDELAKAKKKTLWGGRLGIGEAEGKITPEEQKTIDALKQQYDMAQQKLGLQRGLVRRMRDMLTPTADETLPPADMHQATVQNAQAAGAQRAELEAAKRRQTQATGQPVPVPAAAAIPDANKNGIDDRDEQAMVAVQAIKETNPIRYKAVMEHIKKKYPQIYGSK